MKGREHNFNKEQYTKKEKMRSNKRNEGNSIDEILKHKLAFKRSNNLFL